MSNPRANNKLDLARLGGGLAAAGLLAAGVYWFAARPWYLRWGATQSETARSLPGDELVPQPKRQATRAITIAAPPSAVWPWLIQIGQERGGLYSYDWLENLAGCDIHSADRVVPEFALQAGDKVRLGPEGYPFFEVVDIQPERALLLGGGPDLPARAESTWLFYIEPAGGDSTRLIIRGRGDHTPTLMNYVMWEGIVDPLNFVMERKMLFGIKERAEALAGA
jgi:hypothetical protein